MYMYIYIHIVYVYVYVFYPCHKVRATLARGILQAGICNPEVARDESWVALLGRLSGVVDVGLSYPGAPNSPR